MIKKHFLIATFLGLFLIFMGCKSWHNLALETTDQPIQLGSLHFPSHFDSLGTVSGYYTYDIVEDTYSDSDNISITFTGGEYMDENITYTLYRELDENPNHFIADSKFVVEVKTGISFGAILASFIGSAITGNESTIGSYSTEKIQINGVVYKVRGPDGNHR